MGLVPILSCVCLSVRLLRGHSPKYIVEKNYYFLCLNFIISYIKRGFVRKCVCTLPILQTGIKRLIMDGFWILRCL